MIKLKSPYNGKGGIVEVGTALSLAADVEKNMVASGNAEYFVAGSAATKEASKGNQDTNPYAAKNAIEMQEIVQGINDIEELEALLAYEEQNKKRKTVIEAINERMAEMEEQDDKNMVDPDAVDPEVPLNLNLNPDDMIVS